MEDDSYEVRFGWTTTLTPGPLRGFRCKRCGKLISRGLIGEPENQPMHVEGYELESGSILVMAGTCATCLKVLGIINSFCLVAVNPLGRIQAGV